MSKATSKITCPNCKKEIDISEVILHQSRENIDKEVNKRIKEREVEIKAEIEKQIKEEQGDRIAVLETEDKEKSNQVKELNKAKAELQRVKREKDEQRSELELENERKLNSLLANLAGTVCMMFPDEWKDWDRAAENFARDKLGLLTSDANKLFTPDLQFADWMDSKTCEGHISKEMAIECLENLLETGKVDWTKTPTYQKKLNQNR